MINISKYILKNGSTIEILKSTNNVRGKRRLLKFLFEDEMEKQKRLEFCANMQNFINMYRYHPIKYAQYFCPNIKLTIWQKTILVALNLKEIIKRKIIKT